jgi:23S rRNA (guanosine2251-2'-O)-methyltransferase
MGRNTLEEILKHKTDIILEVYTGLTFKQGQRKDLLIEEIEQKKISIKYVSNHQLSSLAGSDSHQSFVAKIKDRNFLDAKTFLHREKQSSFVLMLDSIADPHNMGAIFRSAECFQVDAIVYSKNRGVDITPVVTKVSCGATELVPILRVSNLAQTAAEFQKQGFEIIVAENRPDAVSLSDFNFSGKTLLIMGSEGEGVQAILRKLADRSLKIPIFGKIDSLNVAQATAVILACMRFQKNI